MSRHLRYSFLLIFISLSALKTQAQEVHPIPKDTLVKLVENYYALNLKIFQANSTVEDIDKVFNLFSPDFTYIHPKYGGLYSRQTLYNGYVRAGVGNASVPFGEIYYNTLRSKEYSIGAHVSYFNMREVSNIKGIDNSNLQVEAFGKRFWRRNTLTSNLSYNREAFNYYGYKLTSNPALGNETIKSSAIVGTKPKITNSVVPMANALRVNASNAIGITYPLLIFESAAIVTKIKFAKNLKVILAISINFLTKGIYHEKSIFIINGIHSLFKSICNE